METNNTEVTAPAAPVAVGSIDNAEFKRLLLEWRVVHTAADLERTSSAIIAYANAAITEAASRGGAADLLFRARVADLVHLLPWFLQFEDATGEKALSDVRAMLKSGAASTAKQEGK